MDQLRQSIGLRAYAQKNPKQEYKRESFGLFEELLGKIKYETIRFLSHIEIASGQDMERLEKQRRNEQSNLEYQHKQSPDAGLADDKPSDSRAQTRQPIQRLEAKVGRNDPCPCQSGKKYKQCCGKI
jgi:preprotein translocase subunit SecA